MKRMSPATRNWIGIFLRCLPICACPFLVLGAEDVYELDPYVVKVTREETTWMQVPRAISVIPAHEVQRARQQVTLDETLQSVPGVFVLNPFNYAQDTRIAIRGFGARADFGIRGIQLLVDGIPATTPDGQGEVDGLDLGSAGQVEVLRGPGSIFYGASSGGAILVQTEDPPDLPYAETRISAGAYGYRHYQFKTGRSFGEGGHVLSAGYLDSDGYRRHSQTENTRFNGKVLWSLDGRQELRLVFNAIDFPLQNDPGGLTREEAAADPRQARGRNVLYDSGESVRQQRLGLQYRKALDESRSLSVNFHYTKRDFSNRLPFESGGQVSFLRDFYGARAMYRQERGGGVLSVGLDLDLQDDHRRNFDNLEGVRGPLALDQSEEVSSAGAFAYYEYAFSDSWKLTSALRHDVVRFRVDDRLLANGDDSGVITFEETTPSLALSWLPRPNLTFYTNISRSFETPTTTEFDNPDGGGFNPDLDVQTARGAEAGMKGTYMAGQAQILFDIAVFHIEIDNALVPYELSQFPDREFFRNAGSSSRQGVEAAIELKFPRGFSFGLNHTWSDFTYDQFLAGGNDFSGNRIPGIPEHLTGMRIAYDSPSGFFAEWQTRFVGSFFANDSNAERIQSYSVTHLRLGHRWTFGDWEFEPYLGVNNLFDESYFANIRINAFGGRHFEPAPDRNLYGGIRVRWLFP